MLDNRFIVWYYNIKIRKGKVNKMKKQTMIRQYRRFSGADGYIVGFEYKKNIYIIEVAEIMPRWTFISYSSSKNGRQPKLQMGLKKAHKEQLIRKGAVMICTAEELEQFEGKNKGWKLETAVMNHFGIENEKGQDNEKFSKCGDMELNGKQLQIKFQNAQVVAEKTLHNLQKQAREEKKLAKMAK